MLPQVEPDYRGLLSNYINTELRPISKNLYININGNKDHRLNLNMLCIGGSGAGKTQFLARPVLMQQSGSFIITDPKGEILQTCGQMLEDADYNVLVLNLLDVVGMAKSTHYNPFVYIRSQTDVVKLITNIMENTTSKNAKSSEPFWENAEKQLLQALFLYVWLECEKKQQRFRTVMELLDIADVEEDRNGQRIPSELDNIFYELEERTRAENEILGRSKRYQHPAVRAYNKVMKGAADTVRSIVQGVNSRLVNMTEDILTVLDEDEFNIPEIGAGVGYDGKTKTAVFCVIPDNDKTYNFIIGMFYTQIFQQLYFYADFLSGMRSLPIHVTFLLDEFYNVALPDDFISLLSTMRSRNISAIIIIQNLAQIKDMYKESLWECIPGNCDTLLYLGGNEFGTHEYMSKSLGEGTYDKSSMSITKSKQGSSSHNYDKFGRKLMTESEVRELDNSKCLILIRGCKPILDEKFDTFSHPLWPKVANANYKYDARRVRAKKRLNDKKLNLIPQGRYDAIKNKTDYDNEIKEEADKVRCVYEFTYEEFINIEVDENEETPRLFSKERIEKNREYIKKRQAYEKANSIEAIAGEYIREVIKLRKERYTFEQIQVILPVLKSGIKLADILDMYSSDMSVEELKEYQKILVA